MGCRAFALSSRSTRMAIELVRIGVGGQRVPFRPYPARQDILLPELLPYAIGFYDSSAERYLGNHSRKAVATVLGVIRTLMLIVIRAHDDEVGRGSRCSLGDPVHGNAV